MIKIASGKESGRKIDFFTSDQHIGHKNIAHLTGRPFNNDYSTDKMDNTIIDRWNRAVNPNQVVLVLGDIALGNIEESLDKWKRMMGVRLLVPGNHDKISSIESKSRQERFRPMYEDAGFIILDETIELDFEGTALLASHYPYHGDSQGRDRHTALRPENKGLPLVHGHTHSHSALSADGSKQFHVGVDAHDFTPVPTSVIEKWIRGLST